MTNEERDIISQFIARVSGAQAPSQPQQWGGSVPATASPPLPPVDREADGLIGQLFNRFPDARYRLTQTAFVQEHALAEAQNRIQRLEWELQQAQQAVQQVQQQQQQSGSRGGFFSGLFGGGGGPQPGPPRPPQQAWNQGPPPGYQQGAPPPGYQQGGPPPGYQQGAPPPPQYAPGYQPGMFQRSGSGFLGSALTTAAGVAGGLVVGNALMNMFSGSHAGGLGGLGGGAASPWSSPTTGVDQGTWSQDAGTGALSNDGYVDSGTWDTSGTTDQPTPWTDNSGDAGWDAGGGGGSDDDSLI